MKRITSPGKLPPGGSDKPVVKAKLATDARNAEGQRRWRAMQSNFHALVSEMKRVTWPSRDEWVSATLVTVGLVVIVALWTSLISYIVSHLTGTAGH
ncbi:MAG: preprotein translocase subunit SecE [Candidatus Eremiobacteraeota bacterium]|nr:preprotein translocase subunit SecE [Candidatus Eremiobacteraeota bacterium]